MNDAHDIGHRCIAAISVQASLTRCSFVSGGRGEDRRFIGSGSFDGPAGPGWSPSLRIIPACADALHHGRGEGSGQAESRPSRRITPERGRRFGAHGGQATIRLDARDIAALKGVDEKPTPRAPGYWRCVLWLEYPDRWAKVDAVRLGENDFICGPRFPSEQHADEEGAEAERQASCLRARLVCGAVRYLRAEYFPDYPAGKS